MIQDKPMRIYVDTSVFGGCFDAEFESHSKRFFQLVHQGTILVLISDLTLEELGEAPERVRDVFDSLEPDQYERVELTEAVYELRDAYIEAGVASNRSKEDATHVAAATVTRAIAIVSWNFKDIVRLDKVRGFNRVNIQNGFGFLTILSPMEVRFDDTEGKD